MLNVQKVVESKIQAAVDLISVKNSFSIEKLTDLASRIQAIFDSDNKIAFVGNGGSAAEAMHLAAEFTGKCVIPHRPLPAICLNESQSALTAIANDFGVEDIFSRQVKAHLRKGDLLIALSTSGKSPNIVRALRAARDLGVTCLLWTGNGEITLDDVEIWSVPSNSTPRIQEIHLIWGHVLAETLEEMLVNSDNSN